MPPKSDQSTFVEPNPVIFAGSLYNYLIDKGILITHYNTSNNPIDPERITAQKRALRGFVKTVAEELIKNRNSSLTDVSDEVLADVLDRATKLMKVEAGLR